MAKQRRTGSACLSHVVHPARGLASDVFVLLSVREVYIPSPLQGVLSSLTVNAILNGSQLVSC